MIVDMKHKFYPNLYFKKGKWYGQFYYSGAHQKTALFEVREQALRSRCDLEIDLMKQRIEFLKKVKKTPKDFLDELK